MNVVARSIFPAETVRALAPTISPDLYSANYYPFCYYRAEVIGSEYCLTNKTYLILCYFNGLFTLLSRNDSKTIYVINNTFLEYLFTKRCIPYCHILNNWLKKIFWNYLIIASYFKRIFLMLFINLSSLMSLAQLLPACHKVAWKKFVEFGGAGKKFSKEVLGAVETTFVKRSEDDFEKMFNRWVSRSFYFHCQYWIVLLSIGRSDFHYNIFIF